MWFIINLIILLLAILAGARKCGEHFGDACTCGFGIYDGEERYIVNCTDGNFRDTKILETLPSDTEILIFTGNYLPELPWNVFGEINKYGKLIVVDMSNNHIREIKGKTYHHVGTVKRLILNHNDLTFSNSPDSDDNYFHPRVFSNFYNLSELHLTNAFAENTTDSLSRNLHDIFTNSSMKMLRKIHLEQNEISHFQDHQLFCDLPALMDIYLGDNLMQSINFNFTCIKNLRFLDLERNRFKRLSRIEMELLDLLVDSPNQMEIDISNNPLVCDCKMQEFYEWIRKTNVTIRNRKNLICTQPTDGEKRIIYFAEVDLCRLRTSAATPVHEAGLITLLVILCLILSVLVGALAYLSRDKLKLLYRPVLKNVSKKVHYQSIKDEECAEVHV